MLKVYCLFLIIFPRASLARNQSEPVYIEPFDRGAGGTVLTRASRDGILYGNPALLKLGKAFVRWAGMQITVEVKGNSEKIQEGIDATKNGSDEINSDLLEAIDFGFGPELTVAVLNQHGGGGVFLDPSVYFRYDSFGNTGIPGARAIIEGLGGAAISGAISPFRWLHLGVTQKQLYGMSRDITITPLNATEAINEFQNLSSYGTGSGTDIGSLIFIQGFNFDFSLGFTMSHLSPVKFTNEAYPTLPPMKNIGLGWSVHAGSSVIDLSAELHDIEASSGEDISRRLRYGSRFLIWKTVGMALGYANAGMSYGLMMDLILLKVTLSYSRRVVGFGESSFIRPEATLTTSLGF